MFLKGDLVSILTDLFTWHQSPNISSDFIYSSPRLILHNPTLTFNTVVKLVCEGMTCM